MTAPTDSRLPSDVSGKQICGLFDITPTKFGVATNNVVTYVDNFGGKQTEVFNGVDVAVNARLRSDLFVTGGFATGNTHFNSAMPMSTTPTRSSASSHRPRRRCHRRRATARRSSTASYDTSWLTQAKLTGSYTLPWQDIQIGGVMQNLPGQAILAYWNIAQSDPTTLGRPLSGGANTSRTIPLIKPGTMYTPRRTQVDLRFGKTLRVGGHEASPAHGRRLQRVQLERRRRRDVERRRAAGSDQHDLQPDDNGMAEAAEHPSGAVREVRRAVQLLIWHETVSREGSFFPHPALSSCRVRGPLRSPSRFLRLFSQLPSPRCPAFTRHGTLSQLCLCIVAGCAYLDRAHPRRLIQIRDPSGRLNAKDVIDCD